MMWKWNPKEKRNNKSLHHILWQKDKDKYNVTEPENKLVITQHQHDAFNLIMGNKQNPRDQLRLLLEERWYPVLSEQVKWDLYDILSRTDRKFYKSKLVK